MKDSRIKEYVLRILYNSKADKIEHLSELVDIGCSFDIDGSTIPVPIEMAKFLEERADGNILGIS